MLETIWENIKYYTKIRGFRVEDIYRSDRVGKGISLTSIQEIAKSLDIPVGLLIEDKEGFEMTRELAWDIVCNELNLTKKELMELNKFKRSVKKLLS